MGRLTTGTIQVETHASLLLLGVGWWGANRRRNMNSSSPMAFACFPNKKEMSNRENNK